jgi:hypothetical protein
LAASPGVPVGFRKGIKEVVARARLCQSGLAINFGKVVARGFDLRVALCGAQIV